MRIHTRRLIIQALALAFTPLALFSSAHATEKGWYLGFGIGQSELADNDTFSGICDELFVVCGDKSSGTAFKAIVGYQINNYIGVEGAYFDLGSPTVSTSAPIVVDASASMSGGSFSVLPQIPIGDIGAIFGKLGFAAGEVKATATAALFDRTESDSVTGGTLLFGAGGAINLGRNATIRAEWEHYAFDETLQLAQRDVDSPNVDVFSISVLFRFPKN